MYATYTYILSKRLFLKRQTIWSILLASNLIYADKNSVAHNMGSQFHHRLYTCYPECQPYEAMNGFTNVKTKAHALMLQLVTSR